MAHHASAKKRIRQTLSRRLRNRFYKKTTRTAIRSLRAVTVKEEAMKFLPKVITMIDKLAAKNRIHKNKAANLVSGLTVHVNKLAK